MVLLIWAEWYLYFSKIPWYGNQMIHESSKFVKKLFEGQEISNSYTTEDKCLVKTP